MICMPGFGGEFLAIVSSETDKLFLPLEVDRMLIPFIRASVS